jgi:hypothetical protein
LEKRSDGSMTTERICPICEKRVDLDQGVYRLDDKTFHPRCYEEWRRKSSTSPERRED